MFAQGKVTTDRNVIQKWVQARHGWPAVIRKMTGSGIDLAISIVFPEATLNEIVKKLSWEEFFEKFDQQQLVFVYQEVDNDRKLSRYFELI